MLPARARLLRLGLFAFLLAAVPANAQRDRPPRGGPGGGEDSGPGPGSNDGEDRGPRPAPPQFAVDACRGSSQGDSCVADTPRGRIDGSCESIDGTLACIPSDDPHRARRAAAQLLRAAPAPAPLPAPVPIPAPVPAPVVAAPAPAPIAAAIPVPAAAPTPAETPVAPSNLLPLAAVLAAAAALLFILWKLVASLKAAPPATPPSDSLSTVISPPPPPAAAHAGPNGGQLLGGNYELGRQIGAGGMGVVYEARDLRLDRRVAIKKMKPEVGGSKRARELFLSEARLVAKLQHPNIVAIHAIIEEAGDLYLVFEHVDGETLDDMLHREKILHPAQAIPILEGVAAAVDYAHTERVIHRDLKPANIMIDKSGRPKVMDFGIAHQAKITISQMTMAAAFGTLAYMPPEQELGQAVRESDIYAFAAVTYEALTGGLAFPGPNFSLQKMSMTFRRPSQAAPALPPRLDAVFERAFQPEPKKRHPTTGEFVRALDGAFAR